jgi:glycosyltransferase involved in cell wall biosynthesis
MRLFALTFGDRSTASTYYRILQYAQWFAQLGIQFDYAPAKGFRAFSSLRDYDVVLLQKAILPGRNFHHVRQNARRLIYDADDRIWLGQYRPHHWWTQRRLERRARRIVQGSDLCLAANQVIAEDLRHFGGRVEVVPMALQATAWPPRQTSGGRLVVGWAGAPKNLYYLKNICPALRRFQHEHPTVSFVIYSGADPKFEEFNYTYIPYHPGADSEIIRRFDIGLLPLPDTPFAHGKSPIKALQYFASKVAVVCSPVGATREIVKGQHNGLWVETSEAWSRALVLLAEDSALRERLAVHGRCDFERRFETACVATHLVGLLRHG